MRKISKQEEVEVSVVIPVYNDPNGIRITLDSLITQSYPVEEYEILVVDNGPTDATQEIIQEFTDTYDHIRFLVENEIQGSYAARNHGIRHANGSIIAFLGADVSVDYKWVELGVQHLFENVDYLACDVELYSMTEETLVGKFDKLWGFQVEQYFNRRHFGPTCGLFVVHPFLTMSVYLMNGWYLEAMVNLGYGFIKQGKNNVLQPIQSYIIRHDRLYDLSSRNDSVLDRESTNGSGIIQLVMENPVSLLLTFYQCARGY